MIRTLPLILILVGLAQNVSAQGPLTPPGSPAPTQKSLQEIWDRVQAQDTQIATLQSQNTALLGKIDNLLTSILGWNVTTVDKGGITDVGRYTSLAFAPNGLPGITYYALDDAGLRYAFSNGTSWAVRAVDGGGGVNVGTHSSLAYRSDGRPYVSYFDWTNSRVRYAWYEDAPSFQTVWDSRYTVDSAHNASGTSLAIDADGNLNIAYINAEGNLSLARPNDSSWSDATIDSPSGSTFPLLYPSLALNEIGSPSIAYCDINDGLKYASFRLRPGIPPTFAWQATTIDDAPLSATSLAIGPDGHPAIAYHVNESDGRLRFARFDGTRWIKTTIEREGDVGRHCSLAFGPDGHPAISYADNTLGALKFARFNGTDWSILIIDDSDSVGRDVGQYTSLAFGPDGHPAISYYDETNGDLKFAYYGLKNSAP